MARLSEYLQGHLWPSPWGNVKCMKPRPQQLLKHKSEILGNKIMQRLWNVSIFTNRSPAAWIFAKQSTTALASLIFNQGRDENPCWTQAWVWSCFRELTKGRRSWMTRMDCQPGRKRAWRQVGTGIGFEVASISNPFRSLLGFLPAKFRSRIGSCDAVSWSRRHWRRAGTTEL